MQHKFRHILDRYLDGKASPQEEELVNKWFEAIQQEQGELDEPVVSDDLKDRILMRVRLTEGPESKEVPANSRYLLRFAAAATILVCLLFAVYMIIPLNVSQNEKSATGEISDFQVVENPNKEFKKINLSDGSQVTLHSGSSLKFPQKFKSGKRDVYLEGEAFFEVTKDPQRPFMVYANDVVTEVLGTTFTVKAFSTDSKVTVSVRTGKVSVYKKSEDSAVEKPVILMPNQQAVYDKSIDRVSRSLVAEPKMILPSENGFQMTFEEAPVTNIFKAIEKAYGVRIEFDENTLSECLLTTSLTDEPLFTRLDIICKAIGATYTAYDVHIVIESTGCH